jgi:hypothetical protein
MMAKNKIDIQAPVISEHDNQQNFAGSFVFSCIQELLDFLEGFDTSDCFFRGQSGLWNVTSSLHRHYGTPRYEKACNTMLAAIEWLKQDKYIRGVVNDNDDYALAIAQHYGCPTDLIDITTDYRTAAYFATTKTTEKLGCLWVFTKRDIEELQDILRSNFFGCFNGLSQDLRDKLTDNEYSQLIQIDIPQLSRLNAQGGAFLWDVAGLLKQQLTWRIIGARFVFKHTGNERNAVAKEEIRLFPRPNQLESEIKRIFTETGGLPKFSGAIELAVSEKEGSLKNGLLSDIVDNAKGKMFFPNPDYFLPSFGEYPWTHRTVTQNDYSTCLMDKEKRVECYLPLNIDGTLKLVEHIFNAVQDNSLTDLLIAFIEGEQIYAINDGDEPILIDIVTTLSNFSYTLNEIAEVVLEWVKIVIFKNKTPNDWDNMQFALIWGYVGELMCKYYGCRVTKLHINEGDNFTRLWLPENYSYLEERYQKEFQSFNKSSYSPPKTIKPYLDSLCDNAKIFIYQCRPQKIMTYDNMKKMFIDLILPQHFAFRRVSDMIYIPDYLTKVGLPIFGKTIYGMRGHISDDMEIVGKFTII